MSDAALSQPAGGVAGVAPRRPNLDAKPHAGALVVFLCLLAIGIGFTLNGLISDIDRSGAQPLAIGAFVLLGIALLIALAFEFVNGFHDTANAVATVIYTHSLPANLAVVWSGAWNLIGVLTSSGAVAFSIVSLLPVELILQVGSSAGFAMIFALLIAAIIWNLGTWALVSVCRRQALHSSTTRRLRRRARIEMNAIATKAMRCSFERSKMVFNRR
jgi:inorganic phosphate transporter, PiT family